MERSMSIWIRWVFTLSVIFYLGFAFAQNQKSQKSNIESSFDESLSNELEEGFYEIESADEEEFGTPKTPIQTEEDLISEEFDALEDEEAPVEDQERQPPSLTDKAQEPTDEDLDAEFSPEELEREEIQEEAEVAETPKKIEQIDEELEAELQEDELEEEEAEVAETAPSETEETKKAEQTPESESPEEVIAEDQQEDLEEEISEDEILEELQEEIIADDQEDLEEEIVEDEIVEDQPEEPAIVEESDDVDEDGIDLVEESEEPQEEEPESVEPESLALLPDEPNLELEAFLDRIFRANSERLSDERWSQITQSVQEDTYRIQVGDTLWDISVTFFGNGHFWPKLWQLNDTITNPHLIYPGRILRFISGGIEAPSIEVTDVQQEELDQQDQEIQQQVATIEEDIEEGESSEEDSLIVESPIIPPSVQSRPILRELPRSLVASELNLDNLFGNLSDRSKIIIESVEVDIDETHIRALHFLSESIPQSLGRIVDVEEWHKTASILQHVYIQSPNLVIGNKYSVFKRRQSVRSPTGGMLGYAIELQGEVEVTEKMPYPRDIYKAAVLRSNTFIEEGSRIGLLQVPSVKLDLEGRQQNIRAQIVGGGNINSDSVLLALHSIVFLDKGSQAGLAVGDILTVRRNQRIRDKSRFVQADRPPIAKIKVVRVTPERTTAFIVQSKETVFIGDYTSGQ